MTLDEAIKEFADWAKGNRKEQNFWAAERDENDETNPLSYADCEGLARDAEPRAEYHEQLVEWLTELKELREENKVLMQECDRLIKEKGELNELIEKAVSDICWREARLREAKRLLKAAVEDFFFVAENFINNMDSLCSMYNHISGCVKGCPMSSSDDYGRCKWRYADEALKLIES